MKRQLSLAALLCLLPQFAPAQTSGAFAPTGSMSRARAEHTATLLLRGKVLIADGSASTTSRATAEQYDPSTAA